MRKLQTGAHLAIADEISMGDGESGHRSESNLRTAIASRTTRSRVVIKKEPEDENDIKDYAETTMNELLGWFGYDKVNSRDTQGLNLHRYTGSGNDEDGAEDSVREGAMGERRRSRRNGSGSADSAAAAKDCLDILISNGGSDHHHHHHRSTGSVNCVTENSSGLDSPTGAGNGRTPTPPQSQTSPINIPNGYVICAWCQKVGMKMFTLRTNNGVKAFCSELCFTQCRRASFKKYKVCDWCKHIRHTVNYVDFQDGEQQLQFCSDKCLNQYKMNIFCKEAQAHLQMHPHLQEAAAKMAAGATSSSSSTASGGAAGGGGSGALTLITPELWLRDCKHRREDDDDGPSNDDDVTYNSSSNDGGRLSDGGDGSDSNNGNRKSIDQNNVATTSAVRTRKRRSFYHHHHRRQMDNELPEDELFSNTRTGSGTAITDNNNEEFFAKAQAAGVTVDNEDLTLKTLAKNNKSNGCDDTNNKKDSYAGGSVGNPTNSRDNDNDAILDFSEDRRPPSDAASVGVGSSRHSRMRERRRHRHHYHQHQSQSSTGKKTGRDTEREGNASSPPCRNDVDSNLPLGGAVIHEKPSPAIDTRPPYRNSSATKGQPHHHHYRQTVRQSLLDRKNGRSAARQAAAAAEKLESSIADRLSAMVGGSAAGVAEMAVATTKSSVTIERHRSLLHNEIANSLAASGSPPPPSISPQHHPHAPPPRYSLFRPKPLPAAGSSSHHPPEDPPPSILPPCPRPLLPSSQAPSPSDLLRAPIMAPGMTPYSHHHPHPPPMSWQLPAEFFRPPPHHFQGVRPPPPFPFMYPPGMQFPMPAPPPPPSMQNSPNGHHITNQKVNPNNETNHQSAGPPVQPPPLHLSNLPQLPPHIGKQPPQNVTNNSAASSSLLPPVTVMVPYPVMVPIPFPVPIPIPIPMTESQFESFRRRLAAETSSGGESTLTPTPPTTQQQQQNELSDVATVMPPTQRKAEEGSSGHPRASGHSCTSKRVDTVITRLVNSKMMSRPPKAEPEEPMPSSPPTPTLSPPSTSCFVAPKECRSGTSVVRVKDELRSSPSVTSAASPDRESTPDSVHVGAGPYDNRSLDCALPPESTDEDSRGSFCRRSDDDSMGAGFSDGGRREFDDSATCGESDVPSTPTSRRRRQLVPFDDESPGMKRKCLRPRLLV